MTSPALDHDGIEKIKSAPTKMDSLDAESSDVDLKKLAKDMQIFEPERIRHLVESCKPKFLRRFFSSSKATRNLRIAAKLGKTDMVKVLLDLGRTDVNNIDKAGQTALHYAAREGHLEIVSILLEKENINASCCNKDGNTPLHIAAKHGHMRVFQKILRDGPNVDVNCTNGSGETPLILAAGRGHEKIVDMLLENPNVVYTLEDHLNTPLHAAAEHGHVVIVEKLLGKVDVNCTNHTCKLSPLHLAIEGDHGAVVDLILGVRTVNPSLKDSSGNTPLHIAAKTGNVVIFEKLLKMPKVDVTSANGKGMKALHIAAKYKHANIVTMLLEKSNVDPCAKTTKDKTPLRMASKFGGVDVVQVLLAKNVDPYLEDNHGDTPLHLAAKFGHKDIAERLLAVPYLDMVNKVNQQNETPLFLAAKHGSIHVVDFLLENPKIDLSVCDEHGDSPFHAAVKGGHVNIAEKLITPPWAIPVHDFNKENMTGLHLCTMKGLEKLVDMLLTQSTVDVNAKDAYGNFPIHYAAQKGNTCILQKILDVPGVDENSINDHLETPLHLAIKAGNVDVVDMLMRVSTLNANMRDRDGNSALHVAALYDEEEMIEKLLKIKGVEVNAKNEDGVTALVLAAKEGHECFVNELLKEPHVLNSTQQGQGEPSEIDWGVCSLLLAACNGHDTIIKSLLKHGVNVNGTHPSVHSTIQGAIQGFRHKTALSEAIEHGRKKVVEELLQDKYIDPNRRNSNEEHPLFIAAKHGHTEIVEKLIKTELIDVNVLSNGKTALQGAARNGREQVVKILLKTPDIDVHFISTYDGETALFDAARNDNETILKDIYEASIANVGSEKRTIHTQLSIDYKNIKGESIIHLAAQENLLNVMDFLFEVEKEDTNAVNVNLKTSAPKGKEDGFIPQSALQIASKAEKNHYKIIEKLTKFGSISFIQEKEGQEFLQHMFEEKKWETFSIVMSAPQVTEYIKALYEDRQASVDAANAILVGAALIAGVTFASWLQPPLGYTTYYHEQFSDNLPAPPVAYPDYAAFDHHPSLQAFWVFNSLSFFSAIATVISGAQSILPTEKLFIKQEVEILRWNLLKTSILLGFSMFFVLLAFATAGAIVLPPLMKFRANIYSTIGIGGSVCFMFLLLFGISIYKLRSDIKNSQKKKKGYFEQWSFKPIRSSSTKDQDST